VSTVTHRHLALFEISYPCQWLSCAAATPKLPQPFRMTGFCRPTFLEVQECAIGRENGS
jgi:hypothetical protein